MHNMKGQPTRVFISYSHDSDEHMERVLHFSEKLRKEGVDSRIDRYVQSPPEGWPQWCLRQVQESEFVLVICTETYYRRFNATEAEAMGKGVSFEGNIVIQTIYDDQSRNLKFIPIVFTAGDLRFIPLVLRGSSFYNVFHVRDYEDLYRRLTHQPSLPMRPIGKVTKIRVKNFRSVDLPTVGSIRVLNDHKKSSLESMLPASGLNRFWGNGQTNSEKTESHDSVQPPTIYATFELKKGRPVVKGNSYKMWVAVKGVPEGTRKVNYEILDDSFRDPKFSVSWGKKDFAEWIISYGDIFLTAKGKSKVGPWRTQTTLLEALNEGYGPKPKTVIRRAIADIANN